MPEKSNEKRERAEAKFERLQKVAEEGRVAMAEYKATALALRAKTEKLRALRMANETGPEGSGDTAATDGGAKKARPRKAPAQKRSPPKRSPKPS